MSVSNVLRVYNMSFEKTGEGYPIRIDHHGETHIFQPSDSSWDWIQVKEDWVDRGTNMKLTQTRYKFVKKEENDLPGYLDVRLSTSRKLFGQRATELHKGMLVSAVEMQDIVDQQLKKKQSALKVIEKELELAEKKVALKKRGPGRPPKAEAQA